MSLINLLRILRKYIGKIGTANDVMKAVETLSLDEVHHGIASANSPFVMKWLEKHNIQLNVCPSSNVMLSIIDAYHVHPIRTLYDHGVPVTINTDDMLVFNQSVSDEFMNLFKCGLMSADELNQIRETGLKQLAFYKGVNN